MTDLSHVLFTILAILIMTFATTVAPSYPLTFSLGVCVGILIMQILHEILFKETK